jgi:hypothetical protein
LPPALPAGPSQGACAQSIAAVLLCDGFDWYVLAGHEAADHVSDGVDAGLVVAAAVDVNHFAQQRGHGIQLGGQPIGDCRFGT